MDEKRLRCLADQAADLLHPVPVANPPPLRDVYFGERVLHFLPFPDVSVSFAHALGHSFKHQRGRIQGGEIVRNSPNGGNEKSSAGLKPAKIGLGKPVAQIEVVRVCIVPHADIRTVITEFPKNAGKVLKAVVAAQCIGWIDHPGCRRQFAGEQ